MIKPLIILVNTVSVFLFTFFFGDTPVTINGNFPKNIKAGQETVAEIVINKGAVSGFAKFQLEVPEGITVKELESKSGNFSFANGIAKIIWTATPSDAEFTLKFTLSTSDDASGLKTLAAKFSFIENNEKSVVEMTPVEIQIGDGGSSEVVTNDNSQNNKAATSTNEVVAPTTSNETVVEQPKPTTPFETPTDPDAKVFCSRTFLKGSNDVTVDVKIKKSDIKGFAKYQDYLPEGYQAKQGKTNGSSFSVSDGKIKFVWVSLPLEEELSISYILEKISDNASNNISLNGEFSYLENDQTKKAKTNSDSYTFDGASSTVASVGKTSENNTSETGTNNDNVSPNTKPSQTTTETSQITKKEGNVSYLVQIGAFKNAIESSILSNKFKLSEPVKSEMAEGYSKFMVGNFNEYKQARSHRESIKQKGCSSAFVVAYNGTKRITVQEALMITSQKWYK